jgi:RND family efflux transporter MFP subunit
MLVLIAAAWFACSGSGPRVASAPEEARAEPELEVTLVAVRRGALAHVISAPGTLEARRESRIGPEVQGTLLHVFVDEGDRVEAGQPLFEIDPEPFQFALRQTEAGLELARAERRQVESDLARARALASQAIVAEQAIEKLETGAAVARAAERQAAESLALARHRLAQTLVRAPYAGSVAARLADEGTTALVQPQTIVLVLQENEVLEARAAIPESQLFLVRPGDPARIRIEGLAAPLETEVAAVGDAIDPATRTYSVRMRVANPERALKAGVFAQVEIRPRALADVVLVPRDAIHSENGGSRVLTVEDGVVRALPVTLGAIAEDAVELVSGPPLGTPVIVGAAQVAPGMRVRALAPAPGEPGA